MTWVDPLAEVVYLSPEVCSKYDKPNTIDIVDLDTSDKDAVDITACASSSVENSVSESGTTTVFFSLFVCIHIYL